MTYRSIVTDAQIAELLLEGIILTEIDPTKIQEALKKLGGELEDRVNAFGQNVEAALDDDTKSLLETCETLEHVETVAGQIVTGLIDTRIKDGNIKTSAYHEVRYQAKYLGNDLVEIRTDVRIYNGFRHTKGQITSDHKYINQDVLGKLKGIEVNSSDTGNIIILERKGKPQTTQLKENIKLPDGTLYAFSHLVEAQFIAQTSMDFLLENYRQQMHKP